MGVLRTMSITIDEELYRTLKKSAGPRGMSRLISEALREKLGGRRQDLYREYLAARADSEREQELSEWDVTQVEGW